MDIRVGDIGRALSPMCPSGAIEVNGERIDARSTEGVIEVGSLVVVLRGDPTGYVVRKFEPGKSPKLPNHGQEIIKAEFARNRTEVAQADRRERAESRRQKIRSLRSGSIAAASLGAIIGLASGGAAWALGGAGDAESAGLALFLVGSLVAFAVVAVALYYLIGLVGYIVAFMQEGEADFSSNVLVTFSTLVGGAIGFWCQFAHGDFAMIALWSGGTAIGFAVVGSFLIWVVENILVSDGDG